MNTASPKQSAKASLELEPHITPKHKFFRKNVKLKESTDLNPLIEDQPNTNLEGLKRLAEAAMVQRVKVIVRSIRNHIFRKNIAERIRRKGQAAAHRHKQPTGNAGRLGKQVPQSRPTLDRYGPEDSPKVQLAHGFSTRPKHNPIPPKAFVNSHATNGYARLYNRLVLRWARIVLEEYRAKLHAAGN